MKQKCKKKKKNGRPIQQNRISRDRISELKDEMVIKGKTEQLLVKQLKTCEKKMQELTDTIKRPNLRSWALKKDKRCKQRECIIYSTK
jgi:hypothetical protein